MKLKARDTVTKDRAKRITAPETQIDKKTQKRVVLLAYIDARSNQQHAPTTKELFLYAAGNNEEGETPDGLDRLSDHTFVVHKNEGGKAIGLDIVPSRLYRSGVIPVSQVDVKTLTVQFDLDGVVARVTQWPANTRAEVSLAVIAELDKLISKGKSIHPTMRLGSIATVVNTTENSVEVRLKAGRRTLQGAPDDFADAEELEESTSES